MTGSRRTSGLIRGVAVRIVVALAVLAVCGLLAATLVRMAPGFGMDERMLDARLDSGSRQAIERQGSAQRDILAYYWNYLRQVSHGDLGTSLSSGRPVAELLSERLALSLRSVFAGLGLAWMLALAAVSALEMSRSRVREAAASLLSGSLLCWPAALVVLACVYLGATPAVAIAAVVFPRIFRYLRDVVRQAATAPHVLTAQALGVAPLRVLAFHIAPPVFPELLALAGVSISMAMGAMVPVEVLCDSPGVGQLVWQAAMARDLQVLVNVTLLMAAITIGGNLFADAAQPARRMMRQCEA